MILHELGHRTYSFNLEKLVSMSVYAKKLLHFPREFEFFINPFHLSKTALDPSDARRGKIA